MTQRQPLSTDLIATIAGSIDAIPPKPASRRELELLIAGIEGQVRAAQERGLTYTEIAAQITRSGYPIKPSTLRIAMQRQAKAVAKPARTKPQRSPKHLDGAADVAAAPPSA